MLLHGLLPVDNSKLYLDVVAKKTHSWQLWEKGSESFALGCLDQTPGPKDLSIPMAGASKLGRQIQLQLRFGMT